MVARGAGAQTGIGQKREFQTEDGAFALEDVPAGTWTVVLEAKGYQTARVANLAVEEGGDEGRRRGARDAGHGPQGPRLGREDGPAGRERGGDVGARGSGRRRGGMFGRGGPLDGLDGGDEHHDGRRGRFHGRGHRARAA